ncbi:MAG TPA: PIG-L deacetylase family protein [Candidatus Acidoferrales bacterium]|jgi:LmbE family N-acetylglucosaminyl deacetylase|nr:PIG-L deacetylase family protein [Candidatus Acidoferrales bacterium]
MIQLGLSGGTNRELSFLFLGAHADDIEIGCGGTILRLAKKYPKSVFDWVVFSASGVRQTEAQHSAKLFVHPAQLREPTLKPFPDGFMPYVGGEVKAVFEELKRTVSPDVVFTHNRKDAHQDHRLIAELTWNTFRDHLILEYEIPKYDGDMGQPNFFVPLEKEMYDNKVRFLMEAFSTQRSKRWFDPQTFLGLMRLRGMECNAPSGFAEAFYSRKLVL